MDAVHEDGLPANLLEEERCQEEQEGKEEEYEGGEDEEPGGGIEGAVREQEERVFQLAKTP